MPFKSGPNQVGGILDPSQTSLSLNQRRTMERLVGQGIDRAVARQLAIALVKTAVAKADWSEADHSRAENGQFGSGPTVGKKSATDEQKANAVSAYGNFSYRDINEAAIKYDSSKGGGDKEEKRLRQHVESLSQAIHDDKLQKDTKLYRGFRLPAGAKEGDVLQPHGFTSASTSKAVANGFAQQAGTDGGHERVVATILAPKGMPALDREKYGGANTNKSEKEFIFDHRQSFRIVKDNGVNAKGVRQLVIEPVASHSLAKSDGHVPPQGVRAACRRGLDLAGEYGGPGLTEGAKARARSMAAGEAQTDEQLARIRSFTARHGSYEKQSSPPSPGYVSWLLWGGDAGRSWANSKGEKTEKSAVSLAKSALTRVHIAKRSYHEAFSAACKEILPQGVVDKLHVRARAIAGGHGKAAARAAAQANSTDVTKADWDEAAHPRKDNGEFGEGGGKSSESHADRASRLADESKKHYEAAAALKAAGDRAGWRARSQEGLAAAKASNEAAKAHLAETKAQTADLKQKLSESPSAKPASSPQAESPPSSQSSAKPPQGVRENGEVARDAKGKSFQDHKDDHDRHFADHEKHLAAFREARDRGDTKAAEKHFDRAVKSGRAGERSARAAEKVHLASLSPERQAAQAKIRAQERREDRDMMKSDRPALGAAFSHAKATGKDQSHEARKRRAQKWLKENGHPTMGRDVKKTAPLPADIRAEQFLKLARQRRKKREADEAQVAKAEQVDIRVPTTIIKAEETKWQKLLWSVVYEPDVFDSHGDRMDAATIQKAAHEAFRQGMYVNHEHVGPPIGAHIVESFTAPVDFTIDDSEGAHVIRKGTWVVGTQVTDDAVWEKVLKGEYGGVSLEGTAFARALGAETA